MVATLNKTTTSAAAGKRERGNSRANNTITNTYFNALYAQKVSKIMPTLTKANYEKWNGQAHNSFKFDIERFCVWSEKQLKRTISIDGGECAVIAEISHRESSIEKSNAYGQKFNVPSGMYDVILTVDIWTKTESGCYTHSGGHYCGLWDYGETISENHAKKNYKDICKASEKITDDYILQCVNVDKKRVDNKADDMEKIKKAAVSEKRKFLEYWSGLSIYKKYEILLDALKWEDCKKLMDKEKPLESRVAEATKNFIMNEYTKQADEFLSKTGAKLAIEFDTYKPYFTDDKQPRNVYKCTLKRNGKQFTFNFGDSIDNTNKGGKPTSYDILACLQKYEVGTFEDFLSEFGYEIDSNESYKQIMNTYKAVCREYKNVYKLFSDVMEELEEIQ